jgi:hypothetical protein
MAIDLLLTLNATFEEPHLKCIDLVSGMGVFSIKEKYDDSLPPLVYGPPLGPP